MASNIKDKELLNDIKKEFNKQSDPESKKLNESFKSFSEANKTEPVDATTQAPPPNNETFINGSAKTEPLNTEADKKKEELKEKLNEFSKGIGLLTGQAITEIIDDFKSNLLWIYAKKKGVDLPKEALKMDAKAKEFCAFLVDYGLKNKLSEYIEKYPLVAAGGVVVLTGAVSYLTIEMLSKTNNENEELKKQIERLNSEKNNAE